MTSKSACSQLPILYCHLWRCVRPRSGSQSYQWCPRKAEVARLCLVAGHQSQDCSIGDPSCSSARLMWLIICSDMSKQALNVATLAQSCQLVKGDSKAPPTTAALQSCDQKQRSPAACWTAADQIAYTSHEGHRYPVSDSVHVLSLVDPRLPYWATNCLTCSQGAVVSLCATTSVYMQAMYRRNCAW